METYVPPEYEPQLEDVRRRIGEAAIALTQASETYNAVITEHIVLLARMRGQERLIHQNHQQ